MTSINYNNNYPYNNQNPMQMQNGVSYQGMPQGQVQPQNQSFEALDKDQLKQDAVEIAGKGKEAAKGAAKDNFILGPVLKMFNIDLDDPKKTAKTIGIMTAVTIALTLVGRSSTYKMTHLGEKIDDVLLNSNLYNKIAGGFNKGKASAAKFFRKSKTIDDICKTLTDSKTKMGPKLDMAGGYGQGVKAIFLNTIGEIKSTITTHKMSGFFGDLNKELKQSGVGFLKRGDIKKLLAEDEVKGMEAIKQILGDAKAGELQKKLTAANDDLLGAMKNLVGDKKASEFCDILKKGKVSDTKAYYGKLREAIADNFNLRNAAGEIDIHKMNAFNEAARKGSYNFNGKNVDLSSFVDITMDSGGALFAWTPVNFVNKIGQKIRGDKWKAFGRANLFDSMQKYNMVNGTAAKTGLGKLAQKLIVVPTEVVGNHTNDLSTMGLFISLMSMGVFSRVQDAPKDKKVATLADDFAAQIGGLTISTPLAFAATYGLASLRNLPKDTTFLGKILKNTVGKLFSMGLVDKQRNNIFSKAAGKAGGVAGGAFRFLMITMVLNAIFAKPITKAVHKIFGKPYDPQAEEAEKLQQAQAEALKNNPAYNMTQEQLIAKFEAHPEIVQAIQQNPQMMAAIQKDPTILLQIAASIPDTPAQAPQTAQPAGTQSPMLQNYLNRQGVQNQAPQAPQMNQMPQMPNYNNQWQQPQMNQFQQNGMQNPFGQPQNQVNFNFPGQNNVQQPKAQPEQTNEPPEPVRTYIPSSKPVTLQNAVQMEGETITNPNVQSILAKADKAEQDAMRYFSK